MLLVERQLELDPLALRDHDVLGRRRVGDDAALERGALEVDVAAGAEGHDLEVVAQPRLEQRLVGGHDAGGARRASRRAARPWPPRRPRASRAARGGPGPMFVMTPTSGSQIAVSSAIWPAPRIASSSTSTSVPNGAASTSSGSPISVLKFARDAATLRCGAIIAAIRSLVEVLPTEPVTAITKAREVLPPGPRERAERRQRRLRGDDRALGLARPAARRPSAAATTTPHAPASSAVTANAPPSTCSPGRPKKRSPGWTARESITARPGPPAGAPAGLLAAAARRRSCRRCAGRSSASRARRRPAAPRARP